MVGILFSHNRLSTTCLDSSGEDLEWTAKKFEKQRSVTFASIDLLEPIEEDFPQVLKS